MPKFAANLTMLFNEVPFPQRFEAAARAGFSAVEYMFPYQEDIDRIASALREFKLTQALFNLPAGDWAAGDRGIAVDPARREEFRAGVQQAVDLARRFGCRKLNCLVGKRSDAIPPEEQWACVVDNVRFAAAALDRAGIMLLVEPVNTHDIPGFFLSSSARAVQLLEGAAATTCNGWRGTWYTQCGSSSSGSATFRWPTLRTVTSPARARSTSRLCSASSTGSATRATSGWNIALPDERKTRSDGSRRWDFAGAKTKTIGTHSRRWSM